MIGVFTVNVIPFLGLDCVIFFEFGINNIGIIDFKAEAISEMEEEKEEKKARAKELAQARKEKWTKEVPVPERRSGPAPQRALGGFSKSLFLTEGN